MTKSGARSRLIVGVVLIVAAVAVGLTGIRNAAARSDRDFAFCGSVEHAVECQTQARPITVQPMDPSSNGSQQGYEVDVQTGAHTYIFFTDLSQEDVAPLRGETALAVVYRDARPVAVMWPDGMAVQFPVAPTHDLWMKVLMAVLLAGLGVFVLLWGIARAVRGPRVQYAY